MKLLIQKEKTGMYFSKLLGEEGIHAVANSPKDAVDILLSLYRDINIIRYERLQKKLFGNTVAKSHLFVGMPDFRSLTISV